VPTWLKFSYLSELLVCLLFLSERIDLLTGNEQEASLADITYLFEQGALVDFEVDELVNLVRALFADTVLRTNTINKILGGHPPSQ
jgi:centromere/kinetochore protein ZW10